MNQFLRAAESRALREHEERILSMRASELPKQAYGVPEADTRIESETERALRTQRIIAILKEDPDVTLGEIVHEIGVSRPLVQATLKAHGLKVKQSANQWSRSGLARKERQQKCAALRAEGLEHQEIAERLGITERQVRYALRPS